MLNGVDWLSTVSLRTAQIDLCVTLSIGRFEVLRAATLFKHKTIMRPVPAMGVTKPNEFIGFGAMRVTKPYEFVGFNGCIPIVG